MSEPIATFAELLAQDTRYKFEAYLFVQRALSYAHRALGMGKPTPSEERAEAAEALALEELVADAPDLFPASEKEEEGVDRHLTGQELCEAIRQYAIEEYGFMAKVVLNSWGVRSTSDFGEIVYNMIRIGLMRKSKQDRREDFDDCYDFEEAFQRRFRFAVK